MIRNFIQGEQGNVNGLDMPSAGCGPTSVGDLTDTIPRDVCAYMVQRGWITNSGGSDHDGTAATINYFAQQTLHKTTNYTFTAGGNITAFFEGVRKGYAGILLMGGTGSGHVDSYWTNYGHFICVCGYSNNQYLVHDPATTARSGYHPIEDFQGRVKGSYMDASTGIQWKNNVSSEVAYGTASSVATTRGVSQQVSSQRDKFSNLVLSWLNTGDSIFDKINSAWLSLVGAVLIGSGTAWMCALIYLAFSAAGLSNLFKKSSSPVEIYDWAKKNNLLTDYPYYHNHGASESDCSSVINRLKIGDVILFGNGGNKPNDIGIVKSISTTGSASVSVITGKNYKLKAEEYKWNDSSIMAVILPEFIEEDPSRSVILRARVKNDVSEPIEGDVGEVYSDVGTAWSNYINEAYLNTQYYRQSGDIKEPIPYSENNDYSKVPVGFNTCTPKGTDVTDVEEMSVFRNNMGYAQGRAREVWNSTNFSSYVIIPDMSELPTKSELQDEKTEFYQGAYFSITPDVWDGEWEEDTQWITSIHPHA